MPAADTPRRVRVERGIYRRPTGVLEVGYRDEVGRQRWRTIDGGILVARKVRDDLSARRARGESVAPKSKLRFGEAADAWLEGPVRDLRDTTQAKYRCMVERHLRPKFGVRRLDAVGAEDLANLVRELRASGKSEATIAVVLGVVDPIYKFAARRLGWTGTIPTTLMLQSERPRGSRGNRRPIFTGTQLEETISAAEEPLRTLFALAALTGARVSELCGLTWGDLRVDDLDEAEIDFGSQVDRQDRRFGEDRTDPAGARGDSGATQARDRADGAGQLRVRDLDLTAAAATQRRTWPSRGSTTSCGLRRSTHVSGASRGRRGGRAGPRRAGDGALDALLPSHGGVARAARGGERRRGRLPARSSRRDGHPNGLRA
jgi:hypothetical protein